MKYTTTSWRFKLTQVLTLRNSFRNKKTNLMKKFYKKLLYLEYEKIFINNHARHLNDGNAGTD